MSNVTEYPVVKTSRRRLTYMGSRAIVTEIRHQSKSTGLRTVYREWIDDATPENGSHPAGTITREVIKGDGRGDGFEIIEPLTVVDGVPAR